MRRDLRDFWARSAIDALYQFNSVRLRLLHCRKYRSVVAGQCGVEIGGPSALFEKVLPLYPYVRDLDGVNFSNDTVWEGSIAAGRNFNYYSGKSGHQYISEATKLSEIASEQYDFLLSSNCLEHVANPLKALLEWKRVIKPGGGLVLVLPNKVSNFDHRRPTTKFDHLLEDLDRDTGEDDLTHLDEILALHDLERDPPAGDIEHFRARSLRNFENRTLHHHVFDVNLIKDMLGYVGFETLTATATPTDFFALAIKKSNAGPEAR
ncbi:methyltransferase domain-containing protein [Mycobacterium sp. 050134]|uniref:methyltransferase domain-containing protein n=1 Tax=Mycobacterium sp. 050134 TaxID=3096111 RepID=UPI002ED95F5A